MLPCPSCAKLTDQELFYEKNGCAISRSAQWGLGRTELRDFDLAVYYTEEYFNGSHFDGYSDYVGSEQVLRTEFSRVVDILKQYCPPGGWVLEIGSAYGFYLKEARESYDVQGIEIAEDAVEACNGAGLPNVHQGVADEQDAGADRNGGRHCDA